MLRSDDHEGDAEERVRTCCVDAECFISAGYGEVHERAFGFTDPVLLLSTDVLREVDLVESFKELVRIFGYAQIPDFLFFLDDIAVADITFATLAVFIGEDDLAVRAVIDESLVSVCETVLEKLQEDPLRPLVIIRICRVDNAVPVKGEADGFQLFAEVLDIRVRDDTRVLVGLDRIILGRESESVETDREQDVIALHTAFSGDDFKACIGFDVSDMHACAARIREFYQTIEFGLVADIFSMEDLFCLPSGLPLRFNFAEVVFHTHSPCLSKHS